MRKLFCILTVVLLTPVMAFATHIDVVGNADCSGWDSTVHVVYSQYAQEGDLTYSVVLYDDMGIEVTRDEATVNLQHDPAGENTYMYHGMWNIEVCGDYTVVGTMHMVYLRPDGTIYREDTKQFNAAFTCICDLPTGCFFTPGYWKNHVEAWPVTSLTLGGVDYSQAELLEIMHTPVRGDATIILAYHLIAAKLNVLSGSPDMVGDAIMAADDLLAMYPIGSKPGNPARQEVLTTKDTLADYNEQGCLENGVSVSKSLDRNGSLDKAEEGISWGNIKSTFR